MRTAKLWEDREGQSVAGAKKNKRRAIKGSETRKQHWGKKLAKNLDQGKNMEQSQTLEPEGRQNEQTCNEQTPEGAVGETPVPTSSTLDDLSFVSQGGGRGGRGKGGRGP